MTPKPNGVGIILGFIVVEDWNLEKERVVTEVPWVYKHGMLCNKTASITPSIPKLTSHENDTELRNYGKSFLRRERECEPHISILTRNEQIIVGHPKKSQKMILSWE